MGIPSGLETGEYRKDGHLTLMSIILLSYNVSAQDLLQGEGLVQGSELVGGKATYR